MTFWDFLAAAFLCAFVTAGIKGVIVLPRMVFEQARQREGGPFVTLAVLVTLEAVVVFFTASALYFLLRLTGVL